MPLTGWDWRKREETGRRGSGGEWGLTEQKNEGDASPTGRSIGENGSRSSAFPGHSTFPVWEIGCRGGVSGHVECSGATGRGRGKGRCRVQQQQDRKRRNLPKQNEKPNCRQEIETPESDKTENHTFVSEQSSMRTGGGEVRLGLSREEEEISSDCQGWGHWG